MAGNHENTNSTQNNLPSSSSSSSTSRALGEKGSSTSGYSSGQKPRLLNPPDPTNPDPATLREQWKFAIKQYSKWYSHAWGTAILAGVSFFALGWIIKGSNPLPSFKQNQDEQRNPPSPDRGGTYESR